MRRTQGDRAWRRWCLLVSVCVALAAGVALGGPPDGAPQEAYTPLGKGKVDPAGGGAFRFVVIGNPVGHADQKATADAQQKGLDVLNQSGAELVICTGDSNPQWNRLCASGLKVPFYNIPGNHDSRDFTRTFGAMRFSFVHKGVHFIGMDDQTPGVWAEQIEWLKKEIAAKPARWRFVFRHEPNRYAGDNWLAEAHPLLAKSNTVAAFGSHHGEYSRWRADGIRYVANRMMDSRGLDYCYIRVDVPAAGRPKLTLMAGDKEYGDDFEQAKSDLHKAKAIESISALAACLPAIVPGDRQPYRFRLPVRNPSRTEEATASLQWRVPPEVLAKITPPKLELKLPPAGSGEAAFAIDVSDPAFRPVDLGIRYTVGGNPVGGASCKVLTARRGAYLTAPPAGAVPEAARLVIADRDQVVLGRPETWTGPADCSAVASVVWTAEGLTVTVEVTDEEVTPKDAIELSLDLRKANRGLYGYQRGVLVAGVAPAAEDKRRAQYVRQCRGGRAKVEVQCEVRAPGYRVVAKVPAASLPEGVGTPGGEMLFDLRVRDADEGHENTLCWSVPTLARGVNTQLAWGRLNALK